jgi:hypothetical protein
MGTCGSSSSNRHTSLTDHIELSHEYKCSFTYEYFKYVQISHCDLRATISQLLNTFIGYHPTNKILTTFTRWQQCGDSRLSWRVPGRLQSCCEVPRLGLGWWRAQGYAVCPEQGGLCFLFPTRLCKLIPRTSSPKFLSAAKQLFPAFMNATKCQYKILFSKQFASVNRLMMLKSSWPKAYSA